MASSRQILPRVLSPMSQRSRNAWRNMPRETGRPDKIEDEELPQKNPHSGADRDARCEAYVQFIPELIPMVPT